MGMFHPSIIVRPCRAHAIKESLEPCRF